MIALHVSAIVCSCISLTCLLLALFSEYWIEDSTGHFGLWNNCTGHTCSSVDVEGFSVSYHAIYAFMILGLIAGAVSLGGLCTCLNKISMGVIPSIASFIAGLCIMIAMSIFSGGIGSTSQFGWSFGLGWASFPLYLLTGCLAYKFHKREAASA